jgi:hypothetical protein
LPFLSVQTFAALQKILSVWSLKVDNLLGKCSSEILSATGGASGSHFDVQTAIIGGDQIFEIRVLMTESDGKKMKQLNRNINASEFVYPEIKEISSNIELAIAASRLYEICQSGKHVQGIILVPDQKNFSWVTLGSGAGINCDALVDPC